MATVTFFNNSNRQGGVYISPVVTVPADVNRIEAHLVSTAWPNAPQSTVITIKVQISRDGGSTWDTEIEVGWVGGSLGKGGTLPSIQINGIGEYVGLMARAYLELAGTLRFSIQGNID